MSTDTMSKIVGDDWVPVPLRIDERLRAAAEQRPQMKRDVWALLHEAATEIERLHAAAFARDADRLARFEEWLADRAGPLLHIDAVREALE